MLTSLGHKLKQIRDKEGLSRTQFFDLTGIPTNTLKNWESGKNKTVASDKLELITRNPILKKYSLWLVTDETAPESGQISPTDNEVSLKPTEHINLPFFEIGASAGDGALVEVEEQTHTISFEPSWLRKEIGVNPNDAFLMLVKGDSMYPTLKNESMIMVDKNLDDLSDGIYVIRHDSNLLVKRLQLLPGGIIKVKSDNAMYEPWEINKSQLDGTDLELIGRVVWTGQRM